MLFLLVTLVQTVHLLCMNLAAAGPLVAVWCEWREARGDRLAGRLGRVLIDVALLCLLLGAALGLLAGWLLWDPRYSAVVRYLFPRVQWGIWELLFSGGLLILHNAWWKQSPQLPLRWRIVRGLLPLAAGTNLLYHFPVLLAVVAELAAQGASPSSAAIDAATFRQQAFQSTVLARSLHFALASFVVAGGFVAAVAARVLRPDNSPGKHKSDQFDHDSQRLVLWGARLAFAAALLQVASGVWVLASLSSAAQYQFTGWDLLSTSLLLVAVTLAIVLLHLLAALSYRSRPAACSARQGGDPVVRWVVILILLIALLMVANLRRSRPTLPPRQAARTAPASVSC